MRTSVSRNAHLFCARKKPGDSLEPPWQPVAAVPRPDLLRAKEDRVVGVAQRIHAGGQRHCVGLNDEQRRHPDHRPIEVFVHEPDRPQHRAIRCPSDPRSSVGCVGSHSLPSSVPMSKSWLCPPPLSIRRANRHSLTRTARSTHAPDAATKQNERPDDRRHRDARCAAAISQPEMFNCSAGRWARCPADHPAGCRDPGHRQSALGHATWPRRTRETGRTRRLARCRPRSESSQLGHCE